MKRLSLSLFIGMGMFIISCEKFLEVDPPYTKITRDLAFADDAAATASVVGIYMNLYKNGSFASGLETSLSSLAGLSADELRNNLQNNPQIVDFERNGLIADNENVLSLWTSMYQAIYGSNALLEGLAESTGVSNELKQQIRGEALFVRAFCHFYLVNCFGDVPLVMSTDYTKNAIVTRTAEDLVYDQIKSDLIEAEGLMAPAYITLGRVRPNKFAASALLARVYLYTRDYPRAEDKATNVIKETTIYNLENFSSVFLSGSKEAIWQLKPNDNAPVTYEGVTFGPINGLQNNVLTDSLVEAFEPDDLRLVNWVQTVSGRYLPFKYKKSELDNFETSEYPTVLRLAEQFLVRAEARVNQGKLTGVNSAASDINEIRSRAGLGPTIADELIELLMAIEQERRVELFTEWGHRWFDLKRTDRATAVLDSFKTGWSGNDELYPLPRLEMENNINLKPQNPGY